MALKTAAELIETLMAWVIYCVIVYLAVISVTGDADNPIGIGLAILLAAIAYSLLHGAEALVAVARAYQGDEPTLEAIAHELDNRANGGSSDDQDRDQNQDRGRDKGGG